MWSAAELQLQAMVFEAMTSKDHSNEWLAHEVMEMVVDFKLLSVARGDDRNCGNSEPAVILLLRTCGIEEVSQQAEIKNLVRGSNSKRTRNEVLLEFIEPRV